MTLHFECTSQKATASWSTPWQQALTYSPTTWSPLSVFKLCVSFGAIRELLAPVVNVISTFTVRPRLSSTCFTSSAIRLESLPVAVITGGTAEGALSLQCPVSVHISSTSPTLKCLRGPLIAPAVCVKKRSPPLLALCVKVQSHLQEESRMNIKTKGVVEKVSTYF